MKLKFVLENVYDKPNLQTTKQSLALPMMAGQMNSQCEQQQQQQANHSSNNAEIAMALPLVAIPCDPDLRMYILGK